MATMSKHHQELTDGVGKCSVPMWMNGLPAGFCDEPAYGVPPKTEYYRDSQGHMARVDGKYHGYVPGLACRGHGGPENNIEPAINNAADALEQISSCDFQCEAGPLDKNVGFLWLVKNLGKETRTTFEEIP